MSEVKEINVSDPKQLHIIRRQLGGLMAALVIEFVLGMILSTLVNYTPESHNAAQVIFLILHILVAIGILIGATTRVVLSLRQHWLQMPSAVGFLSSIGAFICGAIAANNGSSVAVFLMAIGFLIAFGAYGYSMGIVFKLSKVS